MGAGACVFFSPRSFEWGYQRNDKRRRGNKHRLSSLDWSSAHSRSPGQSVGAPQPGAYRCTKDDAEKQSMISQCHVSTASLKLGQSIVLKQTKMFVSLANPLARSSSFIPTRIAKAETPKRHTHEIGIQALI